MHTSWSDLIVAYIILGSTAIGIPALFFIITFLPGLMRTTGEQIGHKEQALLNQESELTTSFAESIGSRQRL